MTVNDKQFSIAASMPATPLGAAIILAADTPPVRRYIKPVYSLGSYTHPTKGWTLAMTNKRMNDHLAEFQKMKLAGIPVKLTKNHKLDADSVVGDILEAMRGNIVNGKFDPNPDGEWGAVVAEVVGLKNIELVESNKDASVEIDSFKIGPDKTRYGEHIRAVSIVPNPLVPGQTGFERIAADDGEDDNRPTYLFSDGEPVMKTLFSSIAGLASICGLTLNAEGMTEASAVEAVGTVKAKLAGLESEKASLTKKLSDAGTGEEEPDLKYLSLSAKNAVAEIKSLKGTGQLSDAGITLLTKELVGIPGGFSKMLSDGEDEDGTTAIERIVKIIRENPGVKFGGKTNLQKAMALDDGGRSASGAGNEPPTAERLRELLNAEPVGASIVARP